LLAAGCWLLTLSVVAVADDAVIGHVVCSRGFVDDTPALGLGPEAQVLAEDWRQEFNGEHPHSALGYRSPAAFAAAWTAPAT
ncbi:MAG: integrase core domain-containing protein, partial [Solirubrobacteraceae bacterium]